MSIEINNLSLGYQDKLVVKNLSLKFPKNKVIALIGPNGCCKSTTLKAVARLLKPKQGSITGRSTLNKDDQAGVSLKSTETSRTKAGAHQVF